VHVRRQIDFQAQQDAMPGHRDRVLAAVVRAACLTSAEPRAAVTGFPETSRQDGAGRDALAHVLLEVLGYHVALGVKKVRAGVWNAVLSGFRLHRFVEDPTHG